MLKEIEVKSSNQKFFEQIIELKEKEGLQGWMDLKIKLAI